MKGVLAVLLLVLAGLAGWAGSGPYRVADEIREGIRTADTALLEKHVDFPRVRDSLKQQLSESISARAERDSATNPFAKMAAGIALALVDSMVDAFVTPAGLAGLAGGSVGDADAGGRDERPEPFRNARKVWESPGRFAIRVPGRDGHEDVVFLLTREGLQWRMTSIRLPGLE